LSRPEIDGWEVRKGLVFFDKVLTIIIRVTIKTFLHVRGLRPLGLEPFLTLSLEISESLNRFSEIFKNWL